MKSIITTIILGIALFWGCSKNSQNGADISDDEKLKVVSVNYPLHYFAQKIGGDLIDAIYPVPSNRDPAYWKPNENELLIFQSADLILLNGADFAKWVEKASLPKSNKINTSRNFKEKYLESNETFTHSHGPEGEHEHKGTASNTWLNFQFALEQASVIRDELIKKLPDDQNKLQENFEKLGADLQALDDRMLMLSQQLDNTKIIGSHPVFQYLSSRYNLNIESVHWEPDEMPDKSGWHDLEHLLSKRHKSILLWEAEPLPEISGKLEKMGVKATVFDLCVNIPENGDFVSKMNKNIEDLEIALK